ncbi:MAG TPA: DsbA family protein [archaeon]|nr:DsbA family protein [archaeon]
MAKKKFWKIATISLAVLLVASMYFNVTVIAVSGNIAKKAEKALITEGMTKGSKNSPVTLIEYSDYECPYCARAEATIKDVLDEYGSKIYFVYKDFPLPFHNNAQKAAEASRCALEQNKYWEYHDALFKNQQSLDTNSLKTYAKSLGLDEAKFSECLDSNKYTEKVKQDMEEGQSKGVTGTPTFFVNGKILIGAQPFDAFKEIIDKELA